jgi:GDPmannose 4,6-dehydratase
MTRVALVTGAGGQDGGYLAEQLLADGVLVHAIAHLREATPQHLGSDVHLHHGEIRDADWLQLLLTQVRPTEIYNLAAISSVAECWADPVACAEVNGRAVAVLLEGAWRLQSENLTPVRFIQASSAAMFGNAPHSPQSESTPISPISPYGAAKAYAHFLLAAYRDRGLHASGLILYNHESPRRPPHFVTRKISTTVANIVRGRAQQLVLGNLMAVRDWGWAPDYVQAMRLAAAADTPDDYVVATGVGHTVQDFLTVAFAAAGIKDWSEWVKSDPALFLPNDPAELVGDANRIRARLGWQPSKDFTAVVEAMVHHDLENPA